MARIADKHGLTNRYRPSGSGKRLVRRGRSKKYLFGAPKRKYTRKTTYTSKSNYAYASNNTDFDAQDAGCFAVVGGIIGIIILAVVPIFRCMLPILIGGILIGIVDKKLKEKWGLPSGKWSMPCSWGWTFLTAAMMIVGFVLTLLVQIGELHFAVLIVATLVYAGLSILILKNKHNKIVKKRKTTHSVKTSTTSAGFLNNSEGVVNKHRKSIIEEEFRKFGLEATDEMKQKIIEESDEFLEDARQGLRKDPTDSSKKVYDWKLKETWEDYPTPDYNAIHTYCSVVFDDSGKSFYYRTRNPELNVGDLVYVPVGYKYEKKIGIIVKMEDFVGTAAPFPLEKTKHIQGKANEFDEDLFDDEYEEDFAEIYEDADDEIDDEFELEDDDMYEEKVKKLCAKLKKHIKSDMSFWDEMHLEFKYNLVPYYDSLQLNYEIKNLSGVPWYNGGGGIMIKVNLYDADGNLLHLDDDFVEDEELARNRHSAFFLIDYDAAEDAETIEIYAYQEQ